MAMINGLSIDLPGEDTMNLGGVRIGLIGVRVAFFLGGGL
jgi:hypothetical protein